MCDPLTLGVAAGGLVGGAVLSKAMRPAAVASSIVTPDPAAERAAAEAEAAQRANQQLAADNRRRRGQQSLMSKGAPQPTLGDTTTADGLSPIGGSGFRATPAANTRASLISLGATPAATTPRPVGGGGGSFNRTSQMAY